MRVNADFRKEWLCAQEWRGTLPESGIGRMFAGRGDGLDGLIVDRFGPLVVASFHEDVAFQRASEAIREDALRNGWRYLARKRTGARWEYFEMPSVQSAEPWHGLAHEGDLHVEVRDDPRHDFGIFTDARAAREVLRTHVADRELVNLFAYTCAFGVVAKLGNARDVTNVDPNRDYLAWGKVNASLNNVDFRVIPDTAQAYLARRIRRLERGEGQSPDVIVLDPPAFLVGRGDNRLGRKVWPELLASVARLEPELLLCLCNDRYLRARQEFPEMLDIGLTGQYDLEIVPQSFEVIGHLGTGESDPHYVPPAIVLCRRRNGRARSEEA